jgi:hypothetical protein
LPAHHGRTGDGVLVEFGSAVNAVQCAINLQVPWADAHGKVPGVGEIAAARRILAAVRERLELEPKPSAPERTTDRVGPAKRRSVP